MESTRLSGYRGEKVPGMGWDVYEGKGVRGRGVERAGRVASKGGGGQGAIRSRLSGMEGR